MNRHSWKAFVVLTGLIAAFAAQPAVARAGLIADTWNAIFGPPGTPYFPGAYSTYYAPSYYTPTWYSAGYGSACCQPATVYYVPSCPPCNPCAVACPTPCDPCAAGPCATLPGPTSGSPPQTFKKPATMNDEPPMPDSKFKSRDDSGKFRPTDKAKKNGTNGKNSAFPTPADGGDGDPGAGKNGTQRKAFRVPTNDPDNAPGPVIRQKKPVPAKAPTEKSDEDKKSVPALALPSFDERITWKPAVRRTRLIINSRVQHAHLARTIADPNSGWKPVRNDTRVVRK